MPSQADNLRMWNNDWVWEKDGDEFHQFATDRGQSYEKWKNSFVETFIQPNLDPNATVLEIGCGHGRWSQYFVGKVQSLILADLSPNCIESCKQRFGQSAATYIVSGGDLSEISASSVDFVWSFDVLVHVDAADIQTYLYQLKRIMKPGAKAILHHADDPSISGWRSQDMSAAHMRRMVEKAGLLAVSQVDSWGPNLIYSVKVHQDIITFVQA